MQLHPVDFKTLTPEIFQVFGTQNALLTAGDRDGCNTMTIGWCQLGRLWSIPVCTVYVRPERYTFQFMESQDYFTVSVMPLSHKQTTMQVCGTQSGRDIDKCPLYTSDAADEEDSVECGGRRIIKKQNENKNWKKKT